MTVARDEIWIDMMQFDVRAADQLWEGIPPAEGAPGWYDDVSGLIGTANGPAEPHELVDEPIVVDDMHRTTRGKPCHRCRRRRTLGRVVAMKAAAATTASVFGVAAAAAATTGIVATVATVVVPVIEDHVLSVDEDEHESDTRPTAPSGAAVGSSDTGLDDQLMALTQAAPATPTPAVSPGPADSEPAADSTTPAPLAPAAEAVVDAAPSPDPTLLEPVAADPAPPTDPAPATAPVESATAEPEHAAKAPPAETPPGKVIPPRDTPADPDASHEGPGRSHGSGRSAARDAPVGDPAAERVEHPRPDHARRSG